MQGCIYIYVTIYIALKSNVGLNCIEKAMWRITGSFYDHSGTIVPLSIGASRIVNPKGALDITMPREISCENLSASPR